MQKPKQSPSLQSADSADDEDLYDQRIANINTALELDRLGLALEDVQNQSLALSLRFNRLGTDDANRMQLLMDRALRISQELQLGVAALSGAVRSRRS